MKSARTRLFSVLVVFIGAIGGVATGQTAVRAAGCSFHAYRAADITNSTASKGAVATIYVPSSSQISGYESVPSSADIYLINGADFVQLGWYVGQASELPPVSTPHVFWGEYHLGDVNNESLNEGPALSWGTFHDFKIGEATDGSYDFLIGSDNESVGETVYHHFTTGQAAFNGEIDSSCTTMYGLATHQDVGPDLQKCTASEFSDCQYFTDHYFTVDYDGAANLESGQVVFNTASTNFDSGGP